MTGEERLLDGIRVLDVASYIAAPAAAMMLADLGAEVIKVEPPGGDAYRDLRNAPGMPRTETDYGWLVDNRNKKGIAIDLKSDAGRGVLYRLAETADVFITNLPLNVRSRLGVTWEDIAPLNDRLIYASLTAYGEAGEEASKTGFDSTAWWARSGLMDLIRPAPDAAPTRSLPGMGDHPTATALFAAIMAGLYRRERTGRGGFVATNLMANGVWSNAVLAQAMLCGEAFQPRPPREESANALVNPYRTRDGRWFFLALVNEERQWPALAAVVGGEELAADPRFRTRDGRHESSRELVKVLDRLFLERDWDELRPALEEKGVTFGVVGRLQDIPDDPQMHAAGVLVPMNDPAGGAGHVVASPLEIGGVEKAAPAAAPGVGQHTREILAAAGYTPDEIARLEESGAVAS